MDLSTMLNASNPIGTAAQAYASHREASMNRGWQEYMSNSAHQREVNDLRQAGLNPILSAGGGNGASTPPGATAPMPDFGSAAQTARMTKLQREEAEARIDRDYSSADAATQAARLAGAQAEKVRQEEANLKNENDRQLYEIVRAAHEANTAGTLSTTRLIEQALLANTLPKSKVFSQAYDAAGALLSPTFQGVKKDAGRVLNSLNSTHPLVSLIRGVVPGMTSAGAVKRYSNSASGKVKYRK